MTQRMLNIGCGSVHHPEWINIDLVPDSPEVIRHDLTRGLPFDSESLDVCYSAHVLEHLRPAEADHLMAEQRRVLKQHGLLRVVIPNLEVICKNYLQYLEEVTAGNLTHEFRYEYSRLEMYDQAVRDRPGGELAQLWKSGTLADLEFVLARSGWEAAAVLNTSGAPPKKSPTRRWRDRWRNVFMPGKLSQFLTQVRQQAAALAVWALAGRPFLRAYQEGVFRNSGEVHRVMYDRFSLAKLLARHGFEEIRVCPPAASRILHFERYQLDVVHGQTRKPDSLFMEAVRA